MSTTKPRGWWLAAGAFALLALGACQKDPEPPAPTPAAVTLPPPATVAEPAAVTASGADHPVVEGSAVPPVSPSVPSAAAVLENASAPVEGSNLNAPFDTTSTLTKEQERNKMPLPGQNNDYSTTQGDEKKSSERRP